MSETQQRREEDQRHSRSEGYRRAVDLLGTCATEDGFLATPSDRANYRRVWARDGAILGLAALLTGNRGLIDAMEQTLRVLARNQGPQGEIPSNVDVETGRVSYGGTTGRVDADLWFVIGCGEYWKATGDDDFLEEFRPALERVHFLLRAWEFNGRGLLYVPAAGDWADEYIQSGYVLYDELLYWQALNTLAELRGRGDDAERDALVERATRLRRLIIANYWFYGERETPEDVYHETLYEKGRRSFPKDRRHWAPFFSPHGYGFRFDAFANVLVSLLGIADDSQREGVDAHIDDIAGDRPRILPAFHPVIRPKDEQWDDLQVTYSHTFRNEPHEYQNGGLWPMITGFYVADLSRRGKLERARAYLDGINWANSLADDEGDWSFPEFVHGKKHTAGGTRCQGWSAAAAVIGQHAIEGASVFRIGPAEE